MPPPLEKVLKGSRFFEINCSESPSLGMYFQSWIGDRIYSGAGWGDPIVGVDKCIYWPSRNANRVLKFDPETQQLPSLVGMTSVEEV